MKKTKIEFEDIKPGDLLEVVVKDSGVKIVATAVAFEKTSIPASQEADHIFWQTSEGGMIVAQDEESAIYRLDVTE